MSKYKILYWYEIPTQVRAEDENGRVSVRLPERFQLAIDDVAMSANLIGEDEYTDGYHWSEEKTEDGPAQEVAQSVAAMLETKYPTIDNRALAKKLRNKKKRHE
ncbi:MAG: virulence factor [Anaerolineales bacterium]